MNHNDIRIGMKMTCSAAKFPGIWTVIKRNPKTIKLEQNGKILNASASYLEPVGDYDETISGAPYKVIMDDLAEAAKFSEGVVVKFKGGRIDGLFVITNVSRDNNLRLFRLGGSPDGRYYRGVSYKTVEIVTVDELLGIELDSVN